MNALSNYPPGVSGNEPQITGEPDYLPPSQGGPDAPGYILRCVECGEDFDALQPAVDHITDGESCDEETTWMILPEEMADTEGF